jgi:hypothetical protein
MDMVSFDILGYFFFSKKGAEIVECFTILCILFRLSIDFNAFFLVFLSLSKFNFFCNS